MPSALPSAAQLQNKEHSRATLICAQLRGGREESHETPQEKAARSLTHPHLVATPGSLASRAKDCKCLPQA